MDMGRGAQKRVAGESRSASICGRRRSQRKKRRLKKLAYEILMGVVVAGLFFGIFLGALLTGNDDGAAQEAETVTVTQRYYMPNSDYYYTDYNDYLQAMEERQAYIDAEEAEAQALQDAIEQYNEEYQASQEEAFLAAQEEKTSLVGSFDWDADDAYLLAKIAMAEAESEPTETKALVILVVLNRVWSENFPNTIEAVIYEEDQFTPIWNGRFDAVEPDADCWAALEMVKSGWDESQGATYFREATDEDCWHNRNLTLLYISGVTAFYKEPVE